MVSATIEFCERVLKHFIAEGKPETAVAMDRTENDAVAARPDRATQCAVRNHSRKCFWNTGSPACAGDDSMYCSRVTPKNPLQRLSIAAKILKFRPCRKPPKKRSP